MSNRIYGLVVGLCLLISQNGAWAQDFPVLSVTEPELGSWEFEDTSVPVQLDVWGGTPLDFSFEADATAYGGSIQDYRFGWDIQDPADDDEWDQWCATCLETDPRNFSSGTHTLRIEARDNNGSVTTAFFVIAVNQSVLTLTEPTLGTWEFTSWLPEPVLVEIEPGRELHFSWQAIALQGGPIDSYRYGWDILDLQDDEQWTTWCASCLSAPSTSFASGSHKLHVQVRDANLQLISTASIVLNVSSVSVETARWSRIKSLYRE